MLPKTILIGLVPFVAAFSSEGLSSCARSNTALESSRRDFVDGLASVVIGSAAAMIGNASPAQAASNEVDFSKIQDLLGSSEASVTNYEAMKKSAGKRPTYLTEPTEEFKQNEARAAEFKREQLKKKREFITILEKMGTDPNDEKLLAGNMDQMRRYIKVNGGLPLGITKKEVITVIRQRKAKKFWPTNVEIAYQDLLLEIQYQQSPNTERDEENPF
mmetsp:Transcript_21831/g.60690  ORF Transcript_21831/g.60690 Transcript_21831/m.60690 type:complete len:217 (+) Transcript_21831:99-749(+)|eukprot:CAMPEP_0168754186 /NCGR_PEP_ID=MMETSP0724-20121128/19364_1 /TAXON_ID=265536 /ORGANISM="Amphiprora sp., Strain CCMP467" /LENGTH=216 /DNA_ID=CAMNT_0008802643 /DNA_START=63 /DNA_END=713 /DNA_ORIENTATION=+